jgi:hypothetical protein
VSAKHGANIITGIKITFGEGKKFGEHLKMLTDIGIIYYITEFKHSEISVFRNIAVTSITKYWNPYSRFVLLCSANKRMFF